MNNIKIFPTWDSEKRLIFEIQKKFLDNQLSIIEMTSVASVMLSDVYADVDNKSLNIISNELGYENAQIKDFDNISNITEIFNIDKLDNVSFITRVTGLSTQDTGLSTQLKYIDIKPILSSVSSNVENLSSVISSIRSNVETISSNVETISSDVETISSEMLTISSLVYQLSDDSPYVRQIQTSHTSGLWGFSYQTSEKNLINDEYVWKDVELAHVVENLSVSDNIIAEEGGKKQIISVRRTSGIVDTYDIIHPPLTDSEISDINSHCSCYSDCPRFGCDPVVNLESINGKLCYYKDSSHLTPISVSNYDLDLSIAGMQAELLFMSNAISDIFNNALTLNGGNDIIISSTNSFNPGTSSTIELCLNKAIFVAGDNMTIVTSDNEVKFSADDNIIVTDGGSTFIDASRNDDTITVKTKNDPSLDKLTLNTLKCNTGLTATTSEINSLSVQSIQSIADGNIQFKNCDVEARNITTTGDVTCNGILKCNNIDSTGKITAHELDIATGDVSCINIDANNIDTDSITTNSFSATTANINTINSDVTINGDINASTSKLTIDTIDVTHLSCDDIQTDTATIQSANINTINSDVTINGDIKILANTIDAYNIKSTDINIKGNSITINEKTYVPTEIEIPKVTLSEGVYVISGIEKIEVLALQNQ